MEQIITWAFLIFISQYIYAKTLNLNNVHFLKIILGFLFSAALAYFVFLLRVPMPYARFAIMILLLGLFAGTITKTKIDLALTAIIISMGIGYGLFLIAVFIFAVISAVFARIFSQPINDILLTLLSLTLQILFVKLLFKIKRLKNGIPFLKKRGAGIIGLVISVFILVAVILIGNTDITNKTLGWLLFGSILCVIGLIFWWRKGLTKLYRDRIMERNTREYEIIIAEKDKQIQKLQENNDFLAKLVHRDNKLLPSMYEAVKISIKNCEDASNSEGMLSSQRTLAQLEQLINERTGLIGQSQRKFKALPSTKDSLIDGVMNHMLAKAAENNTQFDLAVIGNISEFVGTLITAIKLEILLADLIENAIIATSISEHKKILVTIGAIGENFYEINVQDSGIPFETDTLINLGCKKISTHRGEGGSGIGYMTVFEILREHNASLIITEIEPKSHGFSKSVKVRFDNKNEYIVQTYIENKHKTMPVAIGTRLLSI